jgi:release factor glutamine methyltransferase
LSLVKARWPEIVDLLLADVGTGSGAVAITLATRIQPARVLAVDIHGPALGVAEANAVRHGVADRIDFVNGDLLEPLQKSKGLFHLVAANLPYVPTGAFADMAPDVRDYEPHRSLDGGVDGLGLIERAVAGGRALLHDDGVMLLEIWPDHGPRLMELGRAGGFDRVRLVKDLAGHDRIAVLDALGEGD